MAANWVERVRLFSLSPSRFLSGTTAEAFLAELLRELRDDRASYSVKVLLLSPLCEHPCLLCPSDSVGEETALELMSVFAQCPPKSVPFRRHLLVALASVLVCTSCASASSGASQDFVDLLLQIAQDPSDVHGDGSQRLLQETAGDCLRELEACCPGLLLQRLELLGALRQRETSRLHQAHAGLQALALRNAVYRLTREPAAGAERLKALLGAGESAAWEADGDPGRAEEEEEEEDPAALRSLVLGPMGTVPALHTGPDCKELRSVVSSLLEESYLLAPPCQAALLHRLVEVVAMVPGVPPGIFRAQLLRLLGTSEVCLLHATLLMKSAFTDSLFSAEDEAFFLKRLVVLSQHPLLAAPEKLFYTGCLLHFPENRPIGGCGDGDESLPVLLTPRLAAPLVPTVFNDSATLLARLHLLCLVYLEEDEDEEEAGGDGQGPAYLYEHLVSLLLIVDSGGSRESVVTFFRAVFLFLYHFSHTERYSAGLTERLCGLYVRHTRLAPHLINLADRTRDGLPESRWAVGLLAALQKVIVEAPPSRLTARDLSRHLKVLARVAEEAEIPQHGTLRFLSGVLAPSASSFSSSSPCVRGDWRLGNAVLAVCRRLLVHPGLDSLLVPLADVLQHVARRYGDTDVQDHARLYYALLTTLSREKLAGVLAQGAMDAGQQVKKRTLSALVAESEELTSALTVCRTDGPIFRLTEADPAPGRRAGQSGNETTTIVDAAAVLEAYRDQFNHAGFASEILLSYQLVHTGVKDPRFDQLFSIRLHFGLTDAHYEELSDISVPCLFGERPPPTVRLRLKPRRPYPTVLRVSALFATQDGTTWHAPLPDVRVEFRQTFRPLPEPPGWGPGERLGVFEALWEETCSDGADGAASLFCCQLRGDALKALVEKHLLPFLVPGPAHEEEEEEEEVRALLFLPPRSHVLLKVRSEEDAAHFDVATDNWQLLPHINTYLTTITAATEEALS